MGAKERVRTVGVTMGTCTWCGKPKAELRRLDAGRDEHWFHQICWDEHVAWLTGKSTKSK